MSEDVTFYLLRRHAYYASGLTFRVYINGEEVSAVRDSKSVSFKGAVGRNVIQMVPTLGHGKSNALIVDGSPDDEFELVCRATFTASKVWLEKWRTPSASQEETSSGWRELSPQRGKTPTARHQFQIHEDSRSSRVIGTDETEIDNREGVTVVERTLTLTKEWSSEIQLSRDESVTRSGKGAIGPSWVHLELELQKLLSSKYSVLEKRSHLQEESMTVQVPAGVLLRVHLTWKIRLQHGRIVILSDDANPVTIPFTVTVGTSFDQRQEVITIDGKI